MNAAIRSQREVIRSMLADLKMPGALEAIDAILSDIDGGRLAGTEAITRLLSAQITLRNNRRLQTAMRSSRLPAIKTLERPLPPALTRWQRQRVGSQPLWVDKAWLTERISRRARSQYRYGSCADGGIR